MREILSVGYVILNTEIKSRVLDNRKALFVNEIFLQKVRCLVNLTGSIIC